MALARDIIQMRVLRNAEPPNPALVDTGPRFQRAQYVWRRTRTLFEQKGAGKLRYKRVLGFGGFGMVQLWQILEPDGKVSREIAVKFPLISGQRTLSSETRVEIAWMGITFRNCEHITQLARIGKGTEIEKGRLYNNPDAESPIIVMEVLPKGSLRDLIGRINAAREFKFRNPTLKNQHKIGYIPNRVLWRMFLCLTRAIIGLAYPPTEEAQNKPAPYREIINPRGLTPPIPSKVIHFDLDPQNILIGDIDHAGRDNEHNRSPKIKIADFGCTRVWNDELDEEGKIKLIQRGKWDWSAPEQRQPQKWIRQYIGHPINVWAIGVTMFNLLTLRHPVDGTWGPLYRQFKQDIRDPPVVPVSTWGWQLVEDDSAPLEAFIQSYDYALRQLIARCMCDDPRNRPDLEELLWRIEYGIYNSDRNFTPRRSQRADFDNYAARLGPLDAVQGIEPDSTIARFYKDHLHDPPIKPDPYASLWSGP
ncbi:kinase-like protein [Hypoxylon sp. FL0890]|nr:kinase-like protein [Hypoxylon sp. FL0890]